MSNFIKKFIFCNVPVHSKEIVWEIKLFILPKEQKEKTVRSYFSFLSMLYSFFLSISNTFISNARLS